MKLKNGGAPTIRDGGNVSVVVLVQVIVMWLAVDVGGIDMPREVAAAFGGLFGYFAARYLRY